MAKKMRKLLAIMLVLSLTVGMFSIHVFAEDAPTLSSPEILPDGEPQGTIEKVENPPQHGKDPITGDDVTSKITETEWSDESVVPDGGSDVTPDPIETTTPEIVGDGETPAAPDDQTISGSSTTITNGEETDTESWISNYHSGVIGHIMTNEGKETVHQHRETIQKDTYYDRLVKDETTVIDKVNGAVTEIDGVEVGKENPDTQLPEYNNPGQWKPVDKSQSDNEWVPGSVNEWESNGDKVVTPGVSSEKDLVGAFDQMKPKEDITIALTPGTTGASSVTVTKDLNLDQFVNDNTTLDDSYADILNGDNEPVYDEDNNVIGKQVSEDQYYEDGTIKQTITTAVIPQYNDDGQLIGYQVSTTTTDYTVEKESDPVSNETYSNVSEGNAYDMNPDMLPDDVKAILEAGGKNTPTANGVEIITVEQTVDEQGNVIYVMTKITTEAIDGEPEDAELTDDDQIAPSGSEDGPNYYLPEAPAAADPYQDSITGNWITTTVKEIYSEDGSRVIGYEKIVEEKDENDVLISRQVERIYETTVSSETDVVTTATSKTVETDTSKTTTETYIYSATEDTRDVTITGTKDVEVKKEVSEDTVTEIVEIDGTEYEFVFEASMSEVRGGEDIKEIVIDESTGMLATIPLEKYSFTAVDTSGSNNRLQPEGGLTWTTENNLQDDNTKNATWYTPYTKKQLEDIQKQLGDNEFVLIGYGLHSDYVAYDDRGNLDNDPTGEHSLKQYALLSKDGISYGYCVELGTSLKLSNGVGISGTIKENNKQVYSVTTNVNSDYIYSKEDILDMDGTEIPLKNGEESLMPLNSIVKNGYSGAATGAGSLDAVKALLIQYGYVEEAATLTEGEALAATQAAIWKYGNKSTIDANNDGIMDGPTFESLKGFVRQYSDNGLLKDTLTEGEQGYDNINALYTVLTDLAEKASEIGAPEKVTKDTIEGATIVLKEEVPVEAYGSVADAVKSTKTDDDKIYKSDLSFTLAVSNSDYNGDLLVYIYAGDELLETRRIAGDDSADDDSILKFADDDVSSSNGSTTYTISDIELAENVDITIRLSGTQYLTSGVYVYSCDNSQNFIGGQNSVYQEFDLEVDLQFSVTEPTETMTTSSSNTEESFTGHREDTKVDTRKDVKHNVLGNGHSRVEETITTNTKVYATIEVTKKVTEDTDAEYEWYNFYDPGVTKPEENMKDELKEEKKEYEEFEEEDVPLGNYEIIEDEEVPLANVPMTGDNSVVWVIMALIAAAGLLMIVFSRKREEA